jgi:hypothetical protein
MERSVDSWRRFQTPRLRCGSQNRSGDGAQPSFRWVPGAIKWSIFKIDVVPDVRGVVRHTSRVMYTNSRTRRMHGVQRQMSRFLQRQKQTAIPLQFG